MSTRVGTILFDIIGNRLNPKESLILESNITGSASSVALNHQATLEFYNDIITLDTGLIVPDKSSEVTTGLSGTIEILVYPSANTPYPAEISSGSTLDISSNTILQWAGSTDYISIVTTDIVGCEYIRVLLDIF